ncbi:hypothetical protein [Pseudomonas lini]
MSSKAPKKSLVERILEADKLGSRWLADGNAAVSKAEHSLVLGDFAPKTDR